jgi:hypothetical protein
MHDINSSGIESTVSIIIEEHRQLPDPDLLLVPQTTQELRVVIFSPTLE